LTLRPLPFFKISQLLLVDIEELHFGCLIIWNGFWVLDLPCPLHVGGILVFLVGISRALGLPHLSPGPWQIYKYADVKVGAARKWARGMAAANCRSLYLLLALHPWPSL